MRLKRADIDAIIAQRAAPDFDNTVLALEKSGAMLSRVSSVFFAMTSAHTNDGLQALDEQFSTELAGLANDIWLNDTLFARVEAVWQDREALDAESRRLTEEMYQHFVLAGARLNADEKAEPESPEYRSRHPDQPVQPAPAGGEQGGRAGGGQCSPA